MKTAGIIIDKWKLPVFKEFLDNSGRVYEVAEMPRLPGGIGGETIALQVKYKLLADIQPIVEAANAECKRRAPFLKGTH